MKYILLLSLFFFNCNSEGFESLITKIYKPTNSPPKLTISVSPEDNTSNLPTNTPITISFNDTINNLTVGCEGNVRISSDDFQTCLPAQLSTDDNKTFIISPQLDKCTNYKIKIVNPQSLNNFTTTNYSSDQGFNTIFINTWTEYTNNPIFGGSGTSKAYYPVVLKVNNNYHIWYGDGTNTRHAVSTFKNFQDITFPANLITGTLASYKTYHPRVKYNPNGWTINNLSYTNPFLLYYTDSVSWSNMPRIALSNNGHDWTDLGPCTGVGTGSIYNFDVIQEDSNNWIGYRDDGGGQIYYLTSTNGIDWSTSYIEVLNTYQTWEDGIFKNISPSIYKINNIYYLFFSGGIGRNDNAFGFATSSNSLTFTKYINNPILSINDGVTWRQTRTYTPSLIKDNNIWTIYYTGVNSTTYSIGYAEKCSNLSE